MRDMVPSTCVLCLRETRDPWTPEPDSDTVMCYDCFNNPDNCEVDNYVRCRYCNEWCNSDTCHTIIKRGAGTLYSCDDCERDRLEYIREGYEEV